MAGTRATNISNGSDMHCDAISFEETDMRCVICKAGDTAPGTVTVTLQRGVTVVVIREVPAAVCRNCGEYYLDEAVAGKLYRQGEEAVQRHAEVEILRYAA